MSADGEDIDGKRPIAGIVTFAVAAGLGILVASLVPQVPEGVRTVLALATGTAPAPRPADEGRKRAEDPSDERAEIVKLTSGQIQTAGIELAPVQDGKLVTRILAPGTIVPHADRDRPGFGQAVRHRRGVAQEARRPRRQGRGDGGAGEP